MTTILLLFTSLKTFTITEDTIHQDPMLSDTSLASMSQIHLSAEILLLTVINQKGHDLEDLGYLQWHVINSVTISYIVHFARDTLTSSEIIKLCCSLIPPDIFLGKYEGRPESKDPLCTALMQVNGSIPSI